MIDEVHNLLAGSYREQRRFLNMLRFLANDLRASLVVFGVNEALEAVRGDDQLARRLDGHYLPLWEDDASETVLKSSCRVRGCFLLWWVPSRRVLRRKKLA